MTRCIDLLAGTRNGPTTIVRPHSRPDPSEIFGDGEITADGPVPSDFAGRVHRDTPG